MTRNRRWWTRSLTVMVVVGLAAGGGVWWSDLRYKGAMEEIEADVMNRRYVIACRKLEKLLSWKTDWNGGITYLLGSCELARGRNQAASAAWARVTPGAAFSERAIRGRMRILHDDGRFAAAERLITEASVNSRNERTALRALLVPMFRELGRIEEAERLIEDRWEFLNSRGEGALEPVIKLVLEHMDLSLNAISVDKHRTELEHAATRAPDDDRVWLGKAYLAIRTGDFDESEHWLAQCLQRAPDDVSVWRAKLKLGMATNRIDMVTEALSHLPDDKSNDLRMRLMEAWLAARRGDTAAERRELESVIAVAPSHASSLARLAELAEKAGETTTAAEFQRRHAEAEKRLARYRHLFEWKQPIRHAQEMAQLAAELGRQFEARAFRTISAANKMRVSISAQR